MTGIAAKCKRPPILLLSLIEGRVLWFGHNKRKTGQFWGQSSQFPNREGNSETQDANQTQSKHTQEQAVLPILFVLSPSPSYSRSLSLFLH